MKISDGIIASLLLVLAYALGTGYVRAARQSHQVPDMPDLNRRVFGAAVMGACGHGVTTPTVPLIAGPGTPDGRRALIEFLGGRREALSCREIPLDTPVEGLDGAQQASLYLMWLAVAVWKITGPAWGSIDRLLGVLFGLSVALCYATCRVAINRFASAAVATVMMLSPLHLVFLSDLRDYSKAPFFLGTLLTVGLLTTRPFSSAMVIAMSAVAGAAIGVGFGLRTDIALNLIIVVGAVAMFLPGRIDRSWRVRVSAVSVCLLCFVAAASPLLASRQSASTVWHWALLGYAHDSDRALDISAAPYEPGYFYSDSYVATTVDAFWGRTTHATGQVSVGIPEYSEASRRYYVTLLSTFPADGIIRGWAAVTKILDLPFRETARIPAGLLNARVESLVTLVQQRLARLEGLGLLLFTIVVLSVSV